MRTRYTIGEEMRFTLPVIAESTFTASVSLVYSAVTGKISAGALAASNVANQAMNLVFAVFAMLTTGSAILVARYTGKNDREAASRTAENSLIMGLCSAIALTAALLVASRPLMRLLMPGAEKDFFREGTTYFRLILLSVPAVVLSNSAASMLRAAGNSRQVLFSNILSNVVQLLSVWLLTSVNQLGIRGAALATVICRYVGAGYLMTALVMNQRGFSIRLKGLFHADPGEVKHIFRVGLPASIDQMSIQLAYVIVNSILVSLGKTQAGVVSVLNSVLIFTGITQGIGSVTATTLVGHRVGAGDLEGARRMGRKILLLCEGTAMLLCVPAVLFPTFSAGLFSSNTDIRRLAADFMWIMFPYCFVAVGVNVCEPVARVGGEVRFTMTAIVLSVWLIRLPLTYLLALKLGMGVQGIYAANILSLGTRFALSFIRNSRPGWGRREL